ncbi:MAG: hypothetical protein KatS3mg110_3430 [Pirellulaceae bacterium]|nr:MAG: hypothetical protein KatS3mg110_3430 [Pirellulaceae bacterium]
MLAVFIHIVVVLVAAGIGFGAAYWLLQNAAREPAGAKRASAPSRTEGPAPELAAKLMRLEQEMAQLRQALAKAESDAERYQRQAEQMQQSQEQVDFQSRELQKMLERMHGLTAEVSSEVASHRTAVESASQELSSNPGPQQILDTVARLLAANDTMRSRLEMAEARLKEQEQMLARQMEEARTDALTRVGNRRAFDMEMARLEKEFRERHRPSSVMMLDVDHFKKFNDTYGHQAGDAVLKNVAQTLRSHLSQDVQVFRYGGEEFAAVFPGCDLENCLPAAERARAAIASQTLEFEGQTLRVTASAGVASFLPQESAADLVKRADEALYACKKAGRNCGHYHDGKQILPIVQTTTACQDEPLAEPSSGEASEIDVPSHGSALRDPLTGLSTEEVFRDDLERRLAAWRRGGPDLALILLEIDRFARLGTTFGSSAQKLVLKAASQFLKAAVRDMDHIARLGNCQFAMLLPGATAENAHAVAERLRLAIGKCRLPCDNGVIQFTVSAGVAQAMQHDTADAFLGRAFQHLKTAQEEGGNTVVSRTTTAVASGTR